ncbi:MAG: iron-sulfur cluster repair di-iron protein [Ignavibacteriaceae bacterium]|nr:iron-sulfur cluster repair di-iron protein [Ignavibacteriaceae bacterium]
MKDLKLNDDAVENLNEMTLAEIVTDNIRSAIVFEEYGLDFCCNGKRSLSEACYEKNVDVKDVINSLARLDSNKDSENVNYWEPDFLLDYIVNNHHQYVRRMIPIISLHADKVASVHGENHPETKQITDHFLAVRQELESHMMKEERILFPYIKQLHYAKKNNEQIAPPPFGTIQNPIRMMEAEHQSAGDAMHKIRELSNNFTTPTDACNTYKALYSELKEFEEDLHKHIHLENNMLFPKSIKLEEELF